MHALYARAADLPPLASTGRLRALHTYAATIANVGGTWRLGLARATLDRERRQGFKIP
jgi:hypothetical protein